MKFVLQTLSLIALYSICSFADPGYSKPGRYNDHSRSFEQPIHAMDAERGWRRGQPARRGNENSARPHENPRLGEVHRDNEREQRDNQTDPAINGCPEGSYRVIMAPDGMSFSVLFDQFVAETKASAQQRVSVLRCHLLIPFQIPEGFSVQITRLDYRGYVNIPLNSKATLRSTFSFQGSQRAGGRMAERNEGRGFNREMGDRNPYAVSFTNNFQGPSDEVYILSSDVFNDRQSASSCGGNSILRVSNILRIQNRVPADAMLTLDSIDGASQQLDYFLSYQACRP